MPHGVGWRTVTDEWTKVISGGRLVKFTYEDFATGVAFMTAQLACHEVVYTVILLQAERPYSRQAVERHFTYELRPSSN